MTSKTKRPGFMLLDALLGAAVFSIFLTAVGVTLLVGHIGFLRSGDHARAVFLAEESLEAVRSIRDNDWESIQEGGPFGIQIGTNGTWEFSGTGTVTDDGYISSIILSQDSQMQLSVDVSVKWDFGNSRTGKISATSIITNWRRIQEIGDWSLVSEQGIYEDAGMPIFTSIQTNESYAFITSEISQGGAGLYVFDITNLSSPQRVANGFYLQGDGLNSLLFEDNLFVAVNNSNSEIQIYDVSSPSSFNESNLLGSINIPGERQARSMAFFDNTLFVGTQESAVEDEVYSYDVSNIGSPILLDSFNTEGSMNDVLLKDGYAFFASSENVAELRVLDIFDPSDIKNAPGNGYNLTDILDAQTIAATGTGLMIGRASGESTEEIILFDIAHSPVPSPPPGPYYKEIGAGINDIVIEPGGRYAFLASDFASKELQILYPDRLVSGQPAEASYVDLNAAGNAVWYSQPLDRLFLVTRNSFHIFQPSP